jgi:chromosome partitioning protein
MICTAGNIKGGCGKTTLAINLVVALAGRGDDVLLIDGDEQGTALAFTELRAGRPGAAGPGYTAVALHGAAIRTQVRQLAPRYDHILIDVGGRDTGSLRAALLVSDLLLVPTAPRSFDLWGVDQTADVLREAREFNSNLRAIAVLNGADASGRDNAEALAALREVAGLEVAEVQLGRRKAFPNAAAAGLGILEYADSSNPDGVAKARAEFRCLLHLLFPERKKQNQ